LNIQSVFFIILVLNLFPILEIGGLTGGIKVAAKKILIVEDEVIVALDIEKKLAKLGYEVLASVTSGEAAIETVKEPPPDLILMDISLAGEIDGIEAAERIQRHYDIPIIYLTAHSHQQTLERAKITEPYGYIVKPFQRKSLHATIETALYKHHMKLKLKEKDENFMNLAENASDGILIATVNGDHIYANRRATELTGYNVSQLLNVCFEKPRADEKNGKGRENWLDKALLPQRREITLESEEKGTISLEITGTKTIWHGLPAVLVLLRDITQLKRADEERKRERAYLDQVRRMEALGTLAGGIAHDVNDLLYIILGFTEMVLADLPRESPNRSRLERVFGACLKAKDVVKQILIFSQPDDVKLKPIKISPLIRKSLKFLRSSIPANIDIQQDIKGESSIVKADPVSINQILINLCNNAVYAMKEQGGVLKVILEEMTLSETTDIADFQLKPGHFLRLTVDDTGTGMGPMVMQRIFEPYFTTRTVSEGTGMGLAVVHGIVKRHRGAVTVQSEPGKGSTFQVYLPTTKEEAITGEHIAISEKVPKGHERILFVDDDETIGGIIKHILERLGYQVVVKFNGLEALEHFRSDPDQFDIVIADMIMPKMTGTELAKEIQDLRPDVPVIICSGFSEKIRAEELKSLKNIHTVIKKPFVMQELGQKIRKALEKND
jgi:PAS domain S-box-containing protein